MQEATRRGSVATAAFLGIAAEQLVTRGEPAQSSGAKAGAGAGAEASRSRGGFRRSGRDADGGSPRWRRGGGRLAALLGAVLGATFVLMLSSHVVGPGGRGAALLRGFALYSTAALLLRGLALYFAAALPSTPGCQGSAAITSCSIMLVSAQKTCVLTVLLLAGLPRVRISLRHGGGSADTHGGTAADDFFARVHAQNEPHLQADADAHAAESITGGARSREVRLLSWGSCQ